MTTALTPEEFSPCRQTGLRQRSLRKHCRMGRATALTLVLATGATLVIGGAAQAQDTWDGSVSTAWEDDANWVDTSEPNAADDVVISDNTVNRTVITLNEAAQTVTVNGTGVLVISDGGSLNSAITDIETGGRVDLDGDHIGRINNESGGRLDLSATGDVDGTVSNESVFTVTGGSIGRLDNLIGGDVDFDMATATVDATIDNAGLLDVNSGVLTVSNDIYINQGTGITTIDVGATLASDATNNTNGTMTIDGVLDGTLDNSGTTALTGTIRENLTNGGTLNVTGATAMIDGNLGSSGLINLQDGDATTTLMISGNAVLGGTLELDADLSDGSSDADTVVVGGALSGSVDLAFNNVGGAGEIVDIDVITYGTTNTLSFGTISGLPTTGAFEYFVEDSGSGAVQLQSRLSAGIVNVGVVVGVTQSLNDGFDLAETGFVGLRGDDTCQSGIHATLRGGQLETNSTYTDTATLQTSIAPVSLTYGGVQLGGNIACVEDVLGGWDVAFGGMFGINQGSSTTDIFDVDSSGATTSTLLSFTDTEFQQTYAGVSVSATRDQWSARLQYGATQTRFTSTNTELVAGRGLDLSDVGYDSRSHNLAGALGYTWAPSASGITLSTAVGFSITKHETDSIDLGADGTLSFDDGQSHIGFISATVSKTNSRPNGAITYFASATMFEDFSDERIATLTPLGGGAGRDVSIGTVGSYTELSAGLRFENVFTRRGIGPSGRMDAEVSVSAPFGSGREGFDISGRFEIRF